MRASDRWDAWWLDGNFAVIDKWPVRWRRAFLLTFPISVPIYVLCIGVYAFGAAMIGFVEWIGQMWRSSE
tara:strand:+ start:2321 stop:2530 length:210 start_codon:yes stop_codon:yes gene_type:complete